MPYGEENSFDTTTVLGAGILPLVGVLFAIKRQPFQLLRSFLCMLHVILFFGLKGPKLRFKIREQQYNLMNKEYKFYTLLNLTKQT